MRKTKSDGWIYLVGDAANPDVAKIGFATSPRTRLQGLQTGSASKLRMVDKIPGTRLGERALHEAFAHLRLHHEWFRDLEVIEHAFDSARERIMDLADGMIGPDWTPDQEGTSTIYEWVPYDPALLVKEAVASIEYHDYGRRTGDWEGVGPITGETNA
jgi:hypothetical protein